jgi:phosphopantothenoylcysteine synthetase/decarboxylase
MNPAPKLISMVRKQATKAKIIGFKVEEKKNRLQEKALDLLKRNDIDFVIGNTISGFNKDENEIWIFDTKGKSIHKKGKKEYLANIILDTIK